MYLFVLELIHRDHFNLERIKKESNEFIEVKKRKGKKSRVNTEGESVDVNQDKNLIAETQISNSKNEREPLTIDRVKRKEDLIALLNKKSYPGLDKLQWKMIRKKGNKLLNKLDAFQDETKQSVLLKKAIKRIESWIT